jgi:hypothetical protein
VDVVRNARLVCAGLKRRDERKLDCIAAWHSLRIAML